MINNLMKISYDPPHSRQMKKSDDFEKTKTADKSASKMMKNENRIKREPANVNFCGLSATTAKAPFSGPRMTKFMKNEKFGKALKIIEDYQLIFGPAFALLLTCIFRPAAIMTLPGKKNQDDKKYASAHSIASGVIGFILSSIIFLPISEGIKAFKKNPKQFIIDKNSYLLKDEKALKTMRTYIDRAPDVLTAVPKGILTVALIPPILKYVFGWEKQKPKAKEEPFVFQSYAFLNFKGLKDDDKKVFQNFMGRAK